jgi:hypothetical protein
MSVTSSFYYHANAKGESLSDFVREIPTFAFHIGGSPGNGPWESSFVRSRGGLTSLVHRINYQVPVHIAIPQPVTERHFPAGKEYSKLTIYAYQFVPSMNWLNGGYMATSGGTSSIALVFRQVKVLSSRPMTQQWKSLPELNEGQRYHLDKLGQSMYQAYAVTLHVAGECDVVE